MLCTGILFIWVTKENKTTYTRVYTYLIVCLLEMRCVIEYFEDFKSLLKSLLMF